MKPREVAYTAKKPPDSVMSLTSSSNTEPSLTCVVYLSPTEVSKRHHDHAEGPEDGYHDSPLLGAGHVPNISVHGDAEKSVATKDDVSLGEPEHPGVPLCEVDVEKYEDPGEDVAQERCEHERLPALI